MSDHEFDTPITPRQREALTAWADLSVPSDFSDRVLAAWHREIAAPQVRNRRRRLVALVATALTLSAAVVTAWVVAWRDAEVVGSPRLANAGISVRDAVTPACRPCHGSQPPHAVPAALEAFDMDAPQSWTRLPTDRAASLRASAAPGNGETATAAARDPDRSPHEGWTATPKS